METKVKSFTIDLEKVRQDYIRNRDNLWWEVGKDVLATLMCVWALVDSGLKQEYGWLGLFLACLLLHIIVRTRHLIQKVTTFQYFLLCVVQQHVEKKG